MSEARSDGGGGEGGGAGSQRRKTKTPHGVKDRITPHEKLTMYPDEAALQPYSCRKYGPKAAAHQTWTSFLSHKISNGKSVVRELS